MLASCCQGCTYWTLRPLAGEGANFGNKSDLSRAPGGCTPLMLLAEADQYHMNLNTIQPVTAMLIRNMDLRSLTSVNTKMNNFVQLAVSRGNLWFLEVSLPLLGSKCQYKEEFESILQNINEKGKASLDMAIYNKRIWRLLEGYGARHHAPPPTDWHSPLPKGHPWLRESHRAHKGGGK